MLQTKIEERKNYTIDKNEANNLFEKYIKKLRITPTWDVQLEFVDDPNWKKPGDFKIDETEPHTRLFIRE